MSSFLHYTLHYSGAEVAQLITSAKHRLTSNARIVVWKWKSEK